MSLKIEFVQSAVQPDVNLSALCRQFGISRPTGYQLIARYRAEGEAGLAERSRRPHGSPRQTDPAIEAQVVALRDKHPTWGGRKLERTLQNRGVADVPRASTCTDILRRHDRLGPPRPPIVPWKRFEYESPNDLWQVDYKGHVAMTTGRCHPLSVLDDHSRFLVGLTACDNEQDGTVRAIMTTLFRRYGMPKRILTDNGSPWGNPHPLQRYTSFSYWLIRLGIDVSHGRPLHPQTQGKVERFHKTLLEELMATTSFHDLASAQHYFDVWRECYNCERPHDALGLDTPISHYQLTTPRVFPETLPAIDYGPDAIVSSIRTTGDLYFRRHRYYVANGLSREIVALRPTPIDGVFDLYYCDHRLGEVNTHTQTLTHAYAELAKEAPMV